MKFSGIYLLHKIATVKRLLHFSWPPSTRLDLSRHMWTLTSKVTDGNKAAKGLLLHDIYLENKICFWLVSVLSASETRGILCLIWDGITDHALVSCSHDLILPRKSMNKVLKLKWGESLKEESLFKRTFQILSPAWKIASLWSSGAVQFYLQSDLYPLFSLPRSGIHLGVV